METFGPIPTFQPLPFPAPSWLLKAFLVIGFYLHALPMNVALTGGIVSASLLLYGQRKPHAYAKRIGGALAFSLPFFVSMAITQGIVPLLFIQLVYGPLFYTSSILMALPWLLVIFLLLSAYYAYYVYTYRRESLGRRGPWVLILAGLLFLTIAFFFSNNTTLMLTPQKWLGMYMHSPYGVNLNLSEPQLLPRYLHFVLAAVAVTGLTIGCFGLYWHPRDPDYGPWLIRFGAGLFLLITLLQIPVGIWFLLSLGPRILWNFLGQDAMGTTVFASAMGLDLVSLAAMALAWKDGTPTPFRVGLTTSLAVIFLMVEMRHLVREYSVRAFFFPEQVPVDTQWSLLVLFLGSFILGVLYIGWLLKLTWKAYHPPTPEKT